MQDVLVTPDSAGLYDISISGTDFASAGGFESAIPVSLFTDARVEAHIVQNSRYRRGWVGNIFYREINRQLGSTLWVLDQARLDAETLNNARVAVQDALQWLIDDDTLTSIIVDVKQQSLDKIVISVTFTDIDDVVKKYKTLWSMTDASQLPTI